MKLNEILRIEEPLTDEEIYLCIEATRICEESRIEESRIEERKIEQWQHIAEMARRR